jgi:hypothetical protein
MDAPGTASLISTVTRQKIVIDRRFHGPPESGHGGYTCGLLAREIGGAAQVSLRSPPPLDQPLALERDGGGRVLLRDGDAVLADARPATLELDPPPHVELADALAASSRCPSFTHHPFPTCFGCGPRRADGDGLRLLPGPVEGSDVVACTWRPDPSLADAAGDVGAEFVWAALDCPTAFALDLSGPPIVLARLTGRIDKAPRPGDQVVITAWRIGAEGRKRYSACTISTPDGELLAASQALWVVLDGPNSFGAATSAASA